MLSSARPYGSVCERHVRCVSRSRVGRFCKRCSISLTLPCGVQATASDALKYRFHRMGSNGGIKRALDDKPSQAGNSFHPRRSATRAILRGLEFIERKTRHNADDYFSYRGWLFPASAYPPGWPPRTEFPWSCAGTQSCISGPTHAWSNRFQPRRRSSHSATTVFRST